MSLLFPSTCIARTAAQCLASVIYNEGAIKWRKITVTYV